MHVLNQSDKSTTEKAILHSLFLIYGVSIVLGRMYCGMHGFSDVLAGSLLGVLLAWLQCAFGPALDAYMYNGGLKEVLVVILVILVLIRIHPEPADSCPCFDDSVAFFGVLIGQEFSNWHFSQTQYSINDPSPGTIPFDLRKLGLIKSILRIALGVFTVFMWRGAMKPSLHRALPPIFRILEKIGLSLPRRFFTKASEYKNVPSPFKDDDLIPSVSELPGMITFMRHPRQRAISVGPVSEADAYETLAYREKRRRESGGSTDFTMPPREYGAAPAVSSSTTSQMRNSNAEQPSKSIDEYENMMGRGSGCNHVTHAVNCDSKRAPTLNQIQNRDGTSAATTATPAAATAASAAADEEAVDANASMLDNAEKNDDLMADDMFRSITRPRVRYDVEVVTKLIVYS
ncbi:mitochondrial aldehyde dehydrogenase, partial [Ascosphaera pollenicola]